MDVAIEVLKNEIICIENKHCVDGQYCDACQYEIDDEDFVNVLNFIIPILKKQEADRWILVTERLPEEDCECRVTVKNGFGKYVGDCYWNKGEKQFENWNAYLDCYVKISDVTAWKPIEEPYTEEDNDKS